MQITERSGSSDDYRYGYQGSEKDDEIKGEGNSYITYYRLLDPRIGKWFSIDPKVFADQSPYSSMDNNPILSNDINGDCPPCIVIAYLATAEGATLVTGGLITSFIVYNQRDKIDRLARSINFNVEIPTISPGGISVSRRQKIQVETFPGISSNLRKEIEGFSTVKDNTPSFRRGMDLPILDSASRIETIPKLDKDLLFSQILSTSTTERLGPENGYRGGKKHGIKMKDNEIQAWLKKSPDKPLGQWGDSEDLIYAGIMAASLEPGGFMDFPIREGSTSKVHNPDGTVSKPDKIRVRNNGNNTFHGFPINSGSAEPISNEAKVKAPTQKP